MPGLGRVLWGVLIAVNERLAHAHSIKLRREKLVIRA